MKKRLLTLLCAIGLMMAGSSFGGNQVKANGWDYETEYDVKFLGSGFWLVSECLEDRGDHCNMPGSKHRIRPLDLFSVIVF